MAPLILNIPFIAITGSTGKTTTREFIASIMKTKWKVLKTIGNLNLPLQNKKVLERYDPSYQAVILELGMGKPGAGDRHAKYYKPNISIITNVGRAHYGNLGSSVEATAKAKSSLIRNMDQQGILLLNNDDENSRFLEFGSFDGEVITIGSTKKADYQASNVEFLSEGIGFHVMINQISETFFIPTFGAHNINNALFAVAICHRLGFSPEEIRKGLAAFKPPIKRLNFYQLKNQAILIDDTANANPDSVKVAIDVIVDKGQGRKKIAVLGSMLELGDHTMDSHKEVGQYLAKQKIDLIYTFGNETKWIIEGAVQAGIPKENVKYFENRVELNKSLQKAISSDSIILVKGSSSMNMYRTVLYIKNRFLYKVILNQQENPGYIYVSRKTFALMNLKQPSLQLHFGAFTKKYPLQFMDSLEIGEIVIPQQLTPKIFMPDLPYEYILRGNKLFIGPVIGIIVYPLYMNNPKKQLGRLSNYADINGLIFLCLQSKIDITSQTIQGLYYDPKVNDFIQGVFPYPSVFFNRVPLTRAKYLHLKKYMGEKIFNYPYNNTDKLGFWQKMSSNPEITSYLPATKRYTSLASLLEMLAQYDSVYLKPTTMAGGHGILLVQKSVNGYVVTDIAGNKYFASSGPQLTAIITKLKVPNRVYILQQPIPVLNNNEEKIDFRIYIQKDDSKLWRFSGIESKVAKTGSIISNSKNRKTMMPGKIALMEIYGLSELDADKKISEAASLAIKVLKHLESDPGHLGDAALDLVIDQDHKIWLLEVQLNYAAEIKAGRNESERKVLPNVLPIPLLYAKALTVF